MVLLKHYLAYIIQLSPYLSWSYVLLSPFSLQVFVKLIIPVDEAMIIKL